MDDAPANDALPEFWDEALEIIRAVPIAFLSTVSRDQPAVRPVTPAYVGTTAYIATDPETLKVRSIAMNPLVELLHWKDFRHVAMRCRASMVTDEELKAEMWDKFGYDLSDFFERHDPGVKTDGHETYHYGLMRIEPFRIEVTSLQRMAANRPPLIWRSR